MRSEQISCGEIAEALQNDFVAQAVQRQRRRVGRPLRAFPICMQAFVSVSTRALHCEMIGRVDHKQRRLNRSHANHTSSRKTCWCLRLRHTRTTALRQNRVKFNYPEFWSLISARRFRRAICLVHASAPLSHILARVAKLSIVFMALYAAGEVARGRCGTGGS